MSNEQHAVDDKILRELEAVGDPVKTVIMKALEYSTRGRESHISKRLYRDIEKIAKEGTL